jgi:CheY-like chemotaxis protein
MPQKTVLVVDDSKVALMTEVMILRREGRFDIVEGKNGEEAIELAVKHQPDLILMDVNMPVMDGFEACRVLRNKAETKSIPIILVTTRGEAENIEAGYENGCSDYVTKPINGSELLSKIKNILG